MFFSRHWMLSICGKLILNKGISRGVLFAAMAFSIIMTGAQSFAQVQFTDATASSGVTFISHFQHSSAGVIAADITGDGYPELFFNDAAGYNNELYLNNGDGTFTEVGSSWGVLSRFGTDNGLFLDWDNDGRLDLVTLHPVGEQLTWVRILRNAGDHFEIMKNAGASLGMHFIGKQMTAFDYDGDGYIDLVTSGGPCGGTDDQAIVLRNNQVGGFEILHPFISGNEGCNPWQLVCADLDGNGLNDVFGAHDFLYFSHLYLHQVDGSMVDVGFDLGIGAGPDMGVAIADYDNDGDQDIYTTDITIRTAGENRLLQNQLADTGELGLKEVANDVGVGDSGVGWGASFFDYDNDAHLDLGVASVNQESRLFHNRGDATYENIGGSIGFAPVGSAQGLIAVDYDLDGDLDVVIANMTGAAQVYRNNGGNAAGSWMKIRLIDRKGADRFAVGSKITIQAGDQTLFHQTKTGTGFHSQEPYILHFGLGMGVGTCDIKVEWPDGQITSVVNVTSDQLVTITRPQIQSRP